MDLEDLDATGSHEVVDEEIHSQIEQENHQVLGKRKRKSWVWEHFDIKYDKKSKTEIGICIHCKSTSYNADSRRGTSNFSRHLLESCAEYEKFISQKSGKSGKQIDQIVYRRLLAEAIMRHSYPFSWVEHENNRKIHKYLNDNVESISRNTAKKICLELHAVLKEKVRDVLLGIPGRICLTTDIWTACTSRGYLCLTAHYVDHNWKLQSKLLCFSHCPPPHGGYELSQQLTKTIVDWGIQHKVFSLSVDNATNMDKMISYLKQGVLKDVICGGKHFHIRCCAHILNLIVKDGLDVIKSCVAKVREAVKYIDGSEGRIDKFFECARGLSIPFSFGLWLDVPTRWNSTYLMLDRAYKYRNALNNYFEEIHGGSRYVLSFEEWAKIEKICNLLEPFYEVTKLFSGSDYPTANLYFPCVWKIHLRILKGRQCGDNDISRAATEMLLKFDKYWREYVMVLAFGVILDPRYKWEFVDYALKKVHGEEEGGKKASELRNQFVELYREYEVPAAGNGNSDLSNLGVTTQPDAIDNDSEIEEFAAYDFINSSNTEIDVYLREQRLLLSCKTDVLNYWRENSRRFPMLSSMARDVLSIPITTVASESTFSMGGRILSKWRSSLKSKNVDALVTCKNWLTGYEDFEEEGESVNLSNDSDDDDEAEQSAA